MGAVRRRRPRRRHRLAGLDSCRAARDGGVRRGDRRLDVRGRARRHVPRLLLGQLLLRHAGGAADRGPVRARRLERRCDEGRAGGLDRARVPGHVEDRQAHGRRAGCTDRCGPDVGVAALSRLLVDEGALGLRHRAPLCGGRAVDGAAPARAKQPARRGCAGLRARLRRLVDPAVAADGVAGRRVAGLAETRRPAALALRDCRRRRWGLAVDRLELDARFEGCFAGDFGRGRGVDVLLALRRSLHDRSARVARRCGSPIRRTGSSGRRSASS